MARPSAGSRSRCAGAPPSIRSVNLPTGATKLSSGSLRALGHGIVTTMANPSRKPYRGVPGFNVSDDVVTPSSPPSLERSLIDNHELITELARFSEGQPLCTESAIRKKWRLNEETWELLGASDEMVRAIEEEKVRRIRSGALKRELAQAHVVRGPGVLASIMDDPRANARPRVDSIKAPDAIADPGPETAMEQERIVIRIDMGSDIRAAGGTPSPADVLVFEAEIPPKPSPIDDWDAPKQLENAPPRRRDDDSGNNF